MISARASLAGLGAALLAATVACERKTGPAAQPADASVSDATSAVVAPPAPPSPPRVPGSWALDCGSPGDAPIAEGSIRLPPVFVFERPDIDAIVHVGSPTYVTEAWKLDAEKGCEHQYHVRLSGAGARAGFEGLARKLDVKPDISGTRYRLHAEKLKEGVPFFVMVEPIGGENIFVNILHRDADAPECMKRAVEALQPSLRPTTGLTALGVEARYASIVRDEGTQPWCQVDYEWFRDEKIYPKVRSWIEGRGHKIGKDMSFDWEDGADGYATKWSVSFRTARKKSEP